MRRFAGSLGVALVAATLAAGAVVALGASRSGGSSGPVPNAFGAPGVFRAVGRQCGRPPEFYTPAGRTVARLKRFVFRVVVAEQAVQACEHRRINRLIICARLHPITENADHGAGNPGDEIGAAGLQECLAAIDGVPVAR